MAGAVGFLSAADASDCRNSGVDGVFAAASRAVCTGAAGGWGGLGALALWVHQLAAIGSQRSDVKQRHNYSGEVSLSPPFLPGT